MQGMRGANRVFAGSCVPNRSRISSRFLADTQLAPHYPFFRLPG